MSEKEIWRLITGLTYIQYYVSNLGRVKNSRGQVLKTEVNPRTHYAMLQLTVNPGHRKGFNIHRLVAQAFVPNPKHLPEVNHINEVRTDNRAENLEWCAHRYNTNYGNHGARVGESDRRTTQSRRIPIIITLPNGDSKYAHSLREAAEITGWSRTTIQTRLSNPDAHFDRDTYHFKYASDKRSHNAAIPKYQNDLDHRRKVKYVEFVNKLKQVHPTIILLSGLYGMHKPAHFRCLKCKHEFTKTPHSLLQQKYGCPYCAARAQAQQNTMTREEAEQRIKTDFYDNLILGDDYTAATAPCTFTCKHCGRKFQGVLVRMLHGAKMHNFVSNGCQHCGKKRTATISNMKRVGKSIEEIQRALAQKHLNWCPYDG